MVYKYRILSIDGGGIRGIIPAMILSYIEQKTGKRIAELFDFIAGTSTGGILALGLTKPDPDSTSGIVQLQYRAEDLVNLYKEKGAKIFHKGLLPPIGPKFGSEGREAVLTEYLSNTPLKKALKEVFVTSYDIELRLPVFFVSNPKAEIVERGLFHKVVQGFTMTQAAMATSAAPTFFEPCQVPAPDVEGGYYALVDGGVFANNPASLAMMEAMISYKRRYGDDLHRAEILLVSLGTGSLTRRYHYEDAKHWSLVNWIQPIINITFDSNSEAVACQLKQLLPSENYYRFQAHLNQANDEMDDASPENIKNLQELAYQIIDHNEAELEQLCRQLELQPEMSLAR